jgi:hypothetical protein
MMYPYAEFLLDFERKHASFTHRNVSSNEMAAVIVETRPFFFLPKIIRNVMFFLGSKWNLHVVCGEMNERFVKQALLGWDVNVIKLPGLYSLPVERYNEMLTSNWFWDFFPEEKLLLFQVDSMLCGRHIGEFLQYDYVGAPCVSADESYIANGGLSLRSRSKVLECLAAKPYTGGQEDVYFTHAMRQIGAKMPDFATAVRFSVESLFTPRPLGVHGTDKCWHSIEEAERIVSGIEY